MADVEGLKDWVECKHLRCVHLVKLIAVMCRIMLFCAVLLAGMLYLVSGATTYRHTWGGKLSPSTCFFLTGKEYGDSVDWLDAGRMALGKESEAKYCGLTPDEVAVKLKDCDDTCSINDALFPWYYLQFFVAIFYGGFFAFMSTLNLLSDGRGKYKGLPKATAILREVWMYLVLTILPSYLLYPMGSVQMLPEPAEQIALVRTPPDYATVQIMSLFFVVPAVTCVIFYITCRVSQDVNVYTKAGDCFNCTLVVTGLMVFIVAIFVILGYFEMGIYFYIDFNFKISIDLTFVPLAMIAKFFLGFAAFLDTITGAIEVFVNLTKASDKVEKYSYSSHNPQ